MSPEKKLSIGSRPAHGQEHARSIKRIPPSQALAKESQQRRFLRRLLLTKVTVDALAPVREQEDKHN